MAFVDSNYLQRAACRAARLSPHDQRLDVEVVRDMLAAGALGTIPAGACRRVYWYDGAFDYGHPSAEGQQRFLHAISQLDLVQPRLGSLSEITPAWHREVREALTALGVDHERFEAHYPLLPSLRQKGVDILLALDLVRHAEHGRLSHALLLAGDSDFAPAIKAARDAGVLITLLAPADSRPSARLRALADETVEIPTAVARGMLRRRSPVTQVAARPEAGSESAPAPEPPRRSARGGNPGRSALRAIEGRPALAATTPADPSSPAAPEILPPPAAPEIEPARFEPFTLPERAGFKIIASEGSARIYLTSLSSEGEFAVRFERDGERSTLATVTVPRDQHQAA
jgi:uncharacterized LabA/DUF88 family protein